ncbi:protein phosphatase 1 regulatory subunit 17 [Rhinatrema bivittatum]|uniref:protein phosphatase 1 regulatory subunit 17 n=1 Tax=Rhinatrema bivittatum TaxID=194408 RepID=UPI00112A00A4|nr:protein phosphatase 1 regulatory subunit 17 [Rhinatrema bivittatum]
MSTEGVQPSDTPEDRMDKQDQHCKLLDDLSEQLLKNCDVKKNQRMSTNIQSTDQQLKKPKRKDTPALPMPPFIPSEHIFSTPSESERLNKISGMQEKPQKGTMTPVSQNTEQELRKPRRKDTPALHLPPFLSGHPTKSSEEAPREDEDFLENLKVKTSGGSDDEDI